MGIFNRETSIEREERRIHQSIVKHEYLKAKRQAEIEAAKRNGAIDGAKKKTNIGITDRLMAAVAAIPDATKIVEDSIGEMPNVGSGFVHEESIPVTKKVKKKTSTPKVVYVQSEPKKEKTLLEQVWDI